MPSEFMGMLTFVVHGNFLSLPVPDPHVEGLSKEVRVILVVVSLGIDEYGQGVG